MLMQGDRISLIDSVRLFFFFHQIIANMTQSGIGAARETDVAALSSGQPLDFDDDTLKGKDIHYCY